MVVNEKIDYANGREEESTFQHLREYHLDNEVRKITPVVRNYFGEVVYWALTLFTVGLFALLFRWNKRLFTSLRFTRVEIERAKYLIILDEAGDEYSIPVELVKDTDGSILILTTFRYGTYIYDPRLLVDTKDEKGNKAVRKGGFVMLRNNL